MTQHPITLYDYWRSSASYRVRIALHIKGLAYEKIPVNLLESQQLSADFMAINPHGAIPAVKIGHTILTQSVPIIEYINTLYPTPNLLGDTAEQSFIIRQISAVVACDIHPLCNLNVIKKVVAYSGDENEKIKWMSDYMIRGLAVIETILTKSAATYCVGDTPTMADCCLIPQIYNAHRWGVDITDLPHANRVYKNCLLHPNFKDAAPKQPT